MHGLSDVALLRLTSGTRFDSRRASPPPAATPSADESQRHGGVHRSTAPAADESETRLTYRRTERTTLLIETQEGDTVALKIETREKVRLTEHAGEEADSIVEQQIRARSTTRLAVFVKGELSSAELAAITDVVAQAAALVEAFYAGDVSGSFATANELGIDAEQLATAVLRLRLRESISYARLGSLPTPRPAADEPESAPAASSGNVSVQTPPTDAAIPPSAAEAVSAAAESGSAAAAADAPVPPDSDGDGGPAADSEAPAAAAPASYFATVLDFLSLLLDTFAENAGTVGSPEDHVPRGLVHYTLKLRIFGRVLVAAEHRKDDTTGGAVETPPPAQAAPALLADTVDALAARSDRQAGISA